MNKFETITRHVNKGRNLASDPELVPAVVVQGRVYGMARIGTRSVPRADHSELLARKYRNIS